MEQWKPIKGYENRYEVSNLGRVRSKDYVFQGVKDEHGYGFAGYVRKGKILAQQVSSRGYKKVCLVTEMGIKKYPVVHRLVAEAFCERSEGCTEVDHINGNKLDNRACNLEWVSHQTNIARAWEKGQAHRDLLRHYRIRCVETGEEFESSVYAAEKLNSTKYQGKKNVITMSRKIRSCILGNYKTMYGFHWENCD